MEAGEVSHLSLPVVHFAGWRYRARVRWSSRTTFGRKREHFPDGVVTRYWLGLLLLVVMADPHHKPLWRSCSWIRQDV
jgi:hypothetical protein